MDRLSLLPIAILASIVMTFLTLFQWSGMREASYEELGERSPVHSVLIPVYAKCRSEIALESPPAAICLKRMHEVAIEIGYAANFDDIRNDIIALENKADRTVTDASK